MIIWTAVAITLTIALAITIQLRLQMEQRLRVYQASRMLEGIHLDPAIAQRMGEAFDRMARAMRQVGLSSQQAADAISRFHETYRAAAAARARD